MTGRTNVIRGLVPVNSAAPVSTLAAEYNHLSSLRSDAHRSLRVLGVAAGADFILLLRESASLSAEMSYNPATRAGLVVGLTTAVVIGARAIVHHYRRETAERGMQNRQEAVPGIEIRAAQLVRR